MQQNKNSAQQFSSEIYQLASTYQLETPIAEYKWRFMGLEFILMPLAGFYLLFDMLVLLPTTVGLIASGSFPYEITSSIFSVISLGLPLWYFIECFRRRAWRVYVFTGGFIYFRRSRPEVFRWEEVYAFRQQIQRYIGNARPSFYIYRIERADGHRILLNNHIRGIAQLGTTLNQQITTALLPEIRQEFYAGEAINFGPLDISLEGLEYKQKQLSWPQVKEISMAAGAMHIRSVENKRPWATIMVSNIPNVFVLMELAGEILKKQRT